MVIVRNSPSESGSFIFPIINIFPDTEKDTPHYFSSPIRKRRDFKKEGYSYHNYVEACSKEDTLTFYPEYNSLEEFLSHYPEYLL
jgi:hypothetical protein